MLAEGAFGGDEGSRLYGITRSAATTLCQHTILRTGCSYSLWTICHQIPTLRVAREWKLHLGSHSLLNAGWIAFSRCNDCLCLHATLIRFGLLHHVGCIGWTCAIHRRESCLAMATEASKGTHVCCRDLHGALHLLGILVAITFRAPWTWNFEFRFLRTSSSSSASTRPT